MLSKLLKYEFKATGRLFLPLYGALLVISFFERICIFSGENFEYSSKYGFENSKRFASNSTAKIMQSLGSFSMRFFIPYGMTGEAAIIIVPGRSSIFSIKFKIVFISKIK